MLSLVYDREKGSADADTDLAGEVDAFIRQMTIFPFGAEHFSLYTGFSCREVRSKIMHVKIGQKGIVVMPYEDDPLQLYDDSDKGSILDAGINALVEARYFLFRIPTGPETTRIVQAYSGMPATVLCNSYPAPDYKRRGFAPIDECNKVLTREYFWADTVRKKRIQINAINTHALEQILRGEHPETKIVDFGWQDKGIVIIEGHEPLYAYSREQRHQLVHSNIGGIIAVNNTSHVDLGEIDCRAVGTAVRKSIYGLPIGRKAPCKNADEHV